MLSGNVIQCQQDSMPMHTNRSILRIIRDLKYGKLANNIKVVDAWCYLSANLSLKDSVTVHIYNTKNVTHAACPQVSINVYF